MNDIRRTILWVVFGFSMVLLWDQWQVYNGHKATFFPASVQSGASAPPASPAAASTVPMATPAVVAQVGAQSVPGVAPDPLGAVPSAPSLARERIVVTTDVFKLTFDTDGGSLLRTEFLQHIDMADKSRNFVLLDDSKERVYLAQTGLIGGGRAESATNT